MQHGSKRSTIYIYIYILYKYDVLVSAYPYFNFNFVVKILRKLKKGSVNVDMFKFSKRY